MSDADGQNDHPPRPGPATVENRARWRLSLIWLVPLIAAVVGLSLAVNAYLSQGPHITINFGSANGLVAGKTEVKFKDVVIGKVTGITLSKDDSHVIVGVDLDRNASDFAAEGTRFWVVRPRVGLGGVSGLGTLLSGAYIGADIGNSHKSKSHFVGLETPPTVTHDSSGTTFVLHAHNLGSLDIGSPVYFRNIQVGRIVDFTLDDDGKGVTLKIFINAPNDRFVTRASRFWNASGLDVSIGTGGLKVNTQSLATVVSGGVAFQSMPGSHDARAASKGAGFKLFPTKDAALQPPNGPGEKIRMRFSQSLRGLSPGAEVVFRGITIGTVSSVDLAYDAETHKFPVDVTAMVYPKRLGKLYKKVEKYRHGDTGKFLQPMIEKGFRAQVLTANLITGQRYISLDFVPRAKPVHYDPDSKPLEIPTAGDNFNQIQLEVSDILAKLDNLPLSEIGAHVNDTVKDANLLLKHMNTGLLPQAQADLKAARRTLEATHDTLAEHSPLQQNLQRTLTEVSRAARSLRALSDYLNRHPQTLIRGKPADPSARYHGGERGPAR